MKEKKVNVKDRSRVNWNKGSVFAFSVPAFSTTGRGPWTHSALCTVMAARSPVPNFLKVMLPSDYSGMSFAFFPA